MRTISLSTDVFASIWADRQPGEESEDDILRRWGLVPKTQAATENPASREPEGFRDAKYGFEVPEGFEIYRTYKGREYKAQATKGHWRRLDTGELFSSLNRLSNSVIDRPPEDAWENWKCINNGKEVTVGELRDQNKVRSRRKR